MRSSPATATAPTPAAPAAPPTAKATTSSTGHKAAQPTSPTSNSSAGNTTENNTYTPPYDANDAPSERTLGWRRNSCAPGSSYGYVNRGCRLGWVRASQQ